MVQPSHRPQSILRSGRCRMVSGSFVYAWGWALTLLLVAPSLLARPGVVVDEVTVGLRDAEGLVVVAEGEELAALLSVREGGAERALLEASPEVRPWRLVVYLDTVLSSTGTLGRATRALELLTRELTALGTVEVVVAEESPRRVLPPSRSADAVAAAFSRANLMERGGGGIVELRREAELEVEMTASPEEARIVALDAATRESALVQQRLDALLGYLAESTGAPDEASGEGAQGSETAGGPAAVFLVGDGFDLDPSVFWRDQPGLADLTLDDDTLKTAHRDFARALAGLGWTALPVSLWRVDGDDPSRWGAEPFRDPTTDRDRILPKVTLGRKTPEQRAEEELRRQAGPPPLPLAPDEPLEALAAATGGRVVSDATDLPAALADLGSRYRLRFASRRSGEKNGGDSLVPLAITSRDERVTVAAPAWAAHGTPRAVSALRARRLLAGELDPGEVTVRAALGLEDGGRAQLEVRVEPPPTAPAGSVTAGPRRVTIATQPGGGGAPTVLHRFVEGRVAGAEVTSGEGAPASTAQRALEVEQWVYRGDLEVPAGTERVAVVVEEGSLAGSPTGSRWGGTVAGIFDSRSAASPAGAYDVAAGLLPGPRPVSLLRPQGEMLTGGVTFDTVVNAAVARVDFYVDGRRRGRVDIAPFRARIDLGRLPEMRRVAVSAFDITGSELGRDELVVNGGAGRLRVRITEPVATQAVGAVDVAAAVDAPQGATLDRLEFYWRDRLAATLFQAPFRHRLRIAADNPEGFLRVVAHLVDGSQAEDVVYLNGPVAGERIDVRLTELYVVVTGSDGRPVRDLPADAFVVRENGESQRVETFSTAGDLPITIGLAIDSSASMFVKLPEVQEAAAEFLGELAAGRDRAFLVDFDDEVRLAAATTGDLVEVRDAGFALVPDGRTSLWKAVVYSLVQLQSAPGRKALVIYSDGADEDGDFPFRDALAFARKVAVPIYVIVSNDEAVRTGGIPIGFPSLGRRLDKLTSEVGGRVWLVRRGEDLADIYRQIEAELSAQYLLGYYPEADGLVDGWRDWRRIEVDVKGRGLEARTLAGYER